MGLPGYLGDSALFDPARVSLEWPLAAGMELHRCREFAQRRAVILVKFSQLRLKQRRKPLAPRRIVRRDPVEFERNTRSRGRR